MMVSQTLNLNSTAPEPASTGLTTTQLLRVGANGDRDAWELLMSRFEPAVSAVINSYRLQEADARDVAQRTWMQVFEHHDKIREPEALGGWLRTTAKHECLRILRDQQRTGPLFEAGTVERPDATVDVERYVVEAEMARHVRGLLPKLPVRSITLICSLFQDDPPCYSELAADTGIPIGSIGPTRARALHSLRRLIEGEPEPVQRSAQRSRCRARAV